MPSEKQPKPSGQSSTAWRLSDEEKNRLAGSVPKLIRQLAADEPEPIDTRAGNNKPTQDELTADGISQAMIAAAAGGDTEGVKALGKLAETLNAKGTK